MQDLQIECEKCGATLTIVREWPDGWKYRATVEPCSDCAEEAAQQMHALDLPHGGMLCEVVVDEEGGTKIYPIESASQ